MSRIVDLLVREEERLSGRGTDALPGGVGTVRFVVRAPAPEAGIVLERAREVLRLVNAESRGDWPSEKQWKQVLPKWFLEQCEREKTQAEAEAWLARWDKLSPEEKQREERDKRWSLRNWLYWLNPDQRAWYWWDGAVVKDDQLVVAIQVDSWPFPWGAFAWLFRTAGAVQVLPEGDVAGAGG
jgi:hypothetical protein